MEKVVEIYGFVVSPFTRCTMMTCEAIGVQYKLNVLNVLKKENLQPEYLKLNPIASIPTLVDDDYVLFDSHAMSAYLCNAYAKDDKWYPKEPRLRGTVDQRLYFHNSVIGPAFKNVGKPLLFGQVPDPSLLNELKNALLDLDKLLGDKQFIALDWPTIADCHCSIPAMSAELVLPEFIPPRVSAWLRRCEKALPGYEKVHGPAVEQMKALFSTVDFSKLVASSNL
ncbi:Glutathione S-transferase 1, isoform D [Frankliniella fusca]|uniref:Glutathione S-transferase 1, isoform D n=1 Tax=Frankliniella fusca TaxID=407009 RepID=A0AAE1HP13_9NEOP|nr:Glutathione S-transferase 1, isoform D [Frankliniella fusca]